MFNSGCIHHMTGEKDMFTTYQPYESSSEFISFPDDSTSPVIGEGKIAISQDDSITNVYHVQSIGYNLLSVSQICKLGYNCLFTDTGVTVMKREDSSIAFMGCLKGILYLVDFTTNGVTPEICLMAKSNVGWLWHYRLAHVGMRNLAKLYNGEHI